MRFVEEKRWLDPLHVKLFRLQANLGQPHSSLVLNNVITNLETRHALQTRQDMPSDYGSLTDTTTKRIWKPRCLPNPRGP